MKKSNFVAGAVVLAVCLLAAQSGFAQTNTEVNAGIQLNFSTPGARSLGLGGAFFGLADDATAAYTNPAGLTTLSKMEVSLEGRQWEYTSTFTDHGHGYGAPTNIGIDSIADFQPGEVTSDTTGLSFLSFVYPGEAWAIAVYRHELANFQTEYDTIGAFFGPPEPVSGVTRFFPIRANMDLEIVNYGASLALRFTDTFTLGIGASYYTFSMNSVTLRHGFATDGTAQGDFFGLPNYDENNIVNYQVQTGDDNDTAYNIGFLWNLSRTVSLGGVYRQGPSFDMIGQNFAGQPGQSDDQASRTVNPKFNVPDVYGLGFAIRATDSFTIAFDWAHVEYSVMAEYFTKVDGNERVIGNLFSAALDEATRQLSVDDADEFHIGLEYVFVNASVPIALRAGSYFDPDHILAFQGDPGDDEAMQTLAALFQPGEDQWHYSLGIGFIFGERFQLDAAVDFADTIQTISLSGVLRF